MTQSKELTPTLRARICELHDIGWGYRRIQKRYPWIPLSTVRYTIIKEPERCDSVSKPRKGRPKKLTEADKHWILEVINENPHITQEDLLTEVSHRVKYCSIRHLLNAENMCKWCCSWRPYLDEKYAIKRLQWAHRHHDFTPADWACVYWSDECTVERGIGIHRE